VRIPIPESIVTKLALADVATDAEIELITSTLRQLENQPTLGEPIPFNLPELRDCYVIWTDDRAWRIVFLRRRPGFFVRNPQIKVLAIDRER
jgi:hypothetical protein